MNIRHYLVLFLAIFVMVGCASKAPPKAEVKPTTRTPPPMFTDTAAGKEPTLATTNAQMSSTDTDQANSLPSQRIIYFDYDMSNITAKSREIIEKHASYLSQNPEVYVRLEGHADERGSREYNLALGEQRAEAAKNTLMMLGVFDNQLTTLSYGEEQPAASGHNEQSWWQNRRVELIYQ
jgi:peptidoglycan-associated lipoprotein